MAKLNVRLVDADGSSRVVDVNIPLPATIRIPVVSDYAWSDEFGLLHPEFDEAHYVLSDDTDADGLRIYR